MKNFVATLAFLVLAACGHPPTLAELDAKVCRERTAQPPAPDAMERCLADAAESHRRLNATMIDLAKANGVPMLPAPPPRGANQRAPRP